MVINQAMGKYGTGNPRQSKAIETGMILFIDRVAADFFLISMKFHNIGLGYLG